MFQMTTSTAEMTLENFLHPTIKPVSGQPNFETMAGGA